MTYAKQINKLWEQMQDAIERAAETGDDETRAALNDYRESSWHNDLENLVQREQQNERQHRRLSPAGWKAPISAYYAAKLLLLGNIAEGAKKTTMPPATIFLNFRQTAAEGITIGYLLRGFLPAIWSNEVETLDYAEIMKAGR